MNFENIWIYVTILLIMVLVGLAYNFIESNKTKKESLMDFGTALDLTGVPVVTFKNNGNNYNFILDTGANYSIINSIILEKFIYTKSNSAHSLIGIEGNSKDVPCVNIHLNYRDYNFKEEFQVVNMNSAFKNIKENTEITIDGILGSEFLRKHGYILDFHNLIAYIKK